MTPRPALLATATLLCFTLATCGSNTGSGPADDKYTQTWSTPYGKTDCATYLNEMTTKQRWAAAADMLTSARNKMDGGSGLPADSLVTRFEDDLATACAGEGQTLITETAVLLYRMDPSYSP